MNQLTAFLAFLRHPRQQATNLAFGNGFMYGLSLNSMMLLIPLYAISEDFRLSDQGIVIAAPAVFMVILRLPGGAISDRFGERVVIWFSFGTLLTAAVIAAFANSILPLIASQLFSGASRSVYWSAAQSYISRSAEGQAGKVMGRQLAFESGAGIIGAIAAGFIAEIFGFGYAFGIAAALCVVGISVTTSLPSLPRKDQVRSVKASFAPVKTMLFSRSLAFAHLVSFMAASYAGLMGGLFIAYFRDIGYSEGFTGLVRAFNGAGVVVVAFMFGVLLTRVGALWTGVFGMVATGLVAIGVASTGDIPVLPVVLMTVSGVTFGTLRTLYPALAAQKSSPNQRAMALSVVSLYWAVAMLLSPLIFGFVADATSIRTAMYIFGTFSVIVGLLSPLVYALGRTAEVPSQEAPPPAASEPVKS
ncbi:MAG: MFS transporter [Chloroflexi bacterium]|nr:MFS transporter [Chloroflexota bacterium]